MPGLFEKIILSLDRAGYSGLTRDDRRLAACPGTPAQAGPRRTAALSQAGRLA
ncbi:hypothetical protein [Achromobacter sp. MFA1 R4]|uniref:hypothetical protein n=1 Tax=Achromobacter sp. MFA1 R4 TaxID=1881016 RepID=UPI0012EC5C81|nr:hypothetical protein [Achromobacter sp. MFA1 R4]